MMASLKTKSVPNNKQVPHESYLLGRRNVKRNDPLSCPVGGYNSLSLQSAYQQSRKNVEPTTSTTNASTTANERNSKVELQPVTPTKSTLSSKYKVSDRIQRLAEPRVRSPSNELSKKELLSLNSMIIYEASPRLIELAKPKKIEKLPPKDPSRIPSRVLKYRANERIIQLSKPRLPQKSATNPPKTKKINPFFNSQKKKKQRLDESRQFYWKTEKSKGLEGFPNIHQSVSDRSIIDVKMKSSPKRTKTPTTRKCREKKLQTQVLRREVETSDAFTNLRWI